MVGFADGFNSGMNLVFQQERADHTREQTRALKRGNDTADRIGDDYRRAIAADAQARGVAPWDPATNGMSASPTPTAPAAPAQGIPTEAAPAQATPSDTPPPQAVAPSQGPQEAPGASRVPPPRGDGTHSGMGAAIESHRIYMNERLSPGATGAVPDPAVVAQVAQEARSVSPEAIERAGQRILGLPSDQSLATRDWNRVSDIILHNTALSGDVPAIHAALATIEQGRLNGSTRALTSAHAAFEAGNLEAGVTALNRANRFMPDGNDYSFRVVGSNVEVTTRPEDGRGAPTTRVMSREQVLSYSDNVLNHENHQKRILEASRDEETRRRNLATEAETARSHRANEGIAGGHLAVARATAAGAERDRQGERNFTTAATNLDTLRAEDPATPGHTERVTAAEAAVNDARRGLRIAPFIAADNYVERDRDQRALPAIATAEREAAGLRRTLSTAAPGSPEHADAQRRLAETETQITNLRGQLTPRGQGQATAQDTARERAATQAEITAARRELIAAETAASTPGSTNDVRTATARVQAARATLAALTGRGTPAGAAASGEGGTGARAGAAALETAAENRYPLPPRPTTMAPPMVEAAPRVMQSLAPTLARANLPGNQNAIQITEELLTGQIRYDPVTGDTRINGVAIRLDPNTVDMINDARKRAGDAAEAAARARAARGPGVLGALRVPEGALRLHGDSERFGPAAGAAALPGLLTPRGPAGLGATPLAPPVTGPARGLPPSAVSRHAIDAWLRANPAPSSPQRQGIPVQ